MKRLLVVTLLVGAMAATEPTHAASSEDAAPIITPPEEQLSFRILMGMVRDRYASAQNDMQRGAARGWRRKHVCSIIQKEKIKDWVGIAKTLTTNSDGYGVVAIEVAQDVLFKTWNNSLSDIGYGTLIPNDSKVFESASQISEGERVVFSASLFASKADCIKESSLTLDGSMKEPDYIMKLKDIRPAP